MFDKCFHVRLQVTFYAWLRINFTVVFLFTEAILKVCIFPEADFVLLQVKLSNCQRVLLLNYDKKSKCIDFRHYSVSAQPIGVSRNIRKLVQRKNLPDLSKLSDVSEFVNK